MRHSNVFPLWGALFLLLFAASPAFGRSDLTLYPVRILGLQNQNWQVAVNVPCGGRLFGFVVNTQNDNMVEISAAVKRERVTCTGWGSEEVRSISFISPDVALRSRIVMEYTSRLSVSEIGDIRLKTDQGRHVAFGIYQHPCKSRVGTLVREQGGRVEMAVLHERDGNKASGCQVQEKVVSLAGVSLPKTMKAVPLPRRTQDVVRSFRLRLAPVVAESIQMNKMAGLSLRYQRRCNEAPIGVVISPPKLAKDGITQQLSVGMLVAEYYNFACDHSKLIAAVAVNEDLVIPSAWQLSALNASGGVRERLDLRLPETSKLRTSNEAEPDISPGFVLKYARGCGKTLGSVYAHDARGHLVVAVLEHKNGKCKGSLKGTLNQPFLARDASTVLPLRVKGG